MNYVIASEKKWNESLTDFFNSKTKTKWVLINKKEDLNLTKLNEIKPEKIFIPHWSHILKPDIYDNFECIAFHITDLPFGRGGSPLQNLITRGIYKTKLSAFQIVKGIDEGGIYLKKDLELLGTAEEIFIRANDLIKEMILEIIEKNLKPVPQEGEAVTFKRRKPEESNIKELNDINQVFDYIRMLDAEHYPSAYIETEHLKFEFSRASLKADGTITADVRISKK
jgi:methionyl-tRNA formyltransferase